MLITIVGPDRFLASQALAAAVEKHAPKDDDFDGLSITRLDGARLTPDELSRSVQAMSLFSSSRLVIVEGLLARFASRGASGESSIDTEQAPTKGRAKRDESLIGSFSSILGAVPDSTVLLLVERGGANKTSALYKAAARYGKVEEYTTPKGVALERWLKERAAHKGIKLTPGAQQALAGALPDLQALESELDKLALYVGTGGVISEETLHEMSYAAKADNVFELTSAIAMRDSKGALARLYRLVEGGTAPEGIMPVLAWQVRTLIAVRDMLDRRVPEGRMAQDSGLNDYSLRKALPQARQFTMPKLLEIHSRLLQLDHEVKTGTADADLTLDALVVAICK